MGQNFSTTSGPDVACPKGDAYAQVSNIYLLQLALSAVLVHSRV
jgi:hypothetical protein